MAINVITERVIGAALKVHAALGPGLLESTYEACMSVELARARLSFERQVAVPIRYGPLHIDCAYRADFIIERQLIIELKSVAKNRSRSHRASNDISEVGTL